MKSGAIINDERAKMAVEMFLKEGGTIEDVSDNEFEEEVRRREKLMEEVGSMCRMSL
jgi:hypothetical protein